MICEWGRQLQTADDSTPCPDEATMRVNITAPPNTYPPDLDIDLCLPHMLRAHETTQAAGTYITGVPLSDYYHRGRRLSTADVLDRLVDDRRALRMLDAAPEYPTMPANGPGGMSHFIGVDEYGDSHRRHISMLIDLAENPDGIGLIDWGMEFPPELVRTMLGVVMAATAFREDGAMGDDGCEGHEYQRLCEAVEEFWAELGKQQTQLIEAEVRTTYEAAGNLRRLTEGRSR